jgi:hypothetical protein
MDTSKRHLIEVDRAASDTWPPDTERMWETLERVFDQHSNDLMVCYSGAMLDAWGHCQCKNCKLEPLLGCDCEVCRWIRERAS